MPSQLEHQRGQNQQSSQRPEEPSTPSALALGLDRKLENLKRLDGAPHTPHLHSPTPRTIHTGPSDYIGDNLSTQNECSLKSDIGSRSNSPLEEYNVPPSLLSPAFTPPTTPGTPSLIGHAAVTNGKPKLMKELPEVNCVVRARIPTTTGTEVFLHLYQNNIDNKEHLAIVFGDKIRSKSLDAPRPGETEMDRMIRGAYEGRLFPGRTTSRITSETRAPPSPLRHPASTPDDLFTILETPLVRIHSECYTGETAWSARCDCGEQLDEAARLMSQDPAGGVVVYLRQEGRGIGLGEKLKAYNLQDLGNDTVQANLILRHPADARSYGLATAILKDLECTNIRLLTNNPDKIAAVEGPNKEVKVVRRVGMVPKMWRGVEGGVAGKEVSEYLRTKITKMGHLLDESYIHEEKVVTIESASPSTGL